MKRYAIVMVVVLALLAVASCNLAGVLPGVVPTPELEVWVRANPGESVANIGHGQTISFGPSADDVDVVFTIKNVGTGNLELETPAPDYVALAEQNQGITPFSIEAGATTQSIGPGSEVTFTIRFAGQNNDTLYTARLLIPSNDPDHSDYFLNLEGDGVPPVL